MPNILITCFQLIGPPSVWQKGRFINPLSDGATNQYASNPDYVPGNPITGCLLSPNYGDRPNMVQVDGVNYVVDPDTPGGWYYKPQTTPAVWIGPASQPQQVSAIPCVKKYCDSLRILLQDNYGYHAEIILPGQTGMPEFAGFVPDTGAIQVPLQQWRGKFSSAILYANNTGLIKPGLYKLYISDFGENWSCQADFTVEENMQECESAVVYPILKPYGAEDQGYFLARVQMGLQATVCPPTEPPAPPVPEPEDPPGPSGENEPQPQTQTETEPISPTPTTPDLCCSEVVAALNSIKSALWAQQRQAETLNENLRVGFSNLAERLSGIQDTLLEPKGCPCEKWLEEIAKSLVVGYDDPEGIKERIADICASFLNLIDSRRG